MANHDLKKPQQTREGEPFVPGALEPEAAPGVPPKPHCGEGLQSFAEHYDLFLVDQWGVLHDGQRVYPGVAECLRLLLSLGKRVVILSNSGQRAEVNALRLRSMGLTGDCYTALITSGEVARESLAARTHPFLPAIGDCCLLLSSDEGRSLVEGLDVEWVPTVAAADFILLAGVGDDQPMAFYQTILEYAVAHKIPLICANPDLVRLSPKGLLFSAGELARRYEQMGGLVHYIGKPYPTIYEHCRKVLPDFDSSRIIAVGDSFFHDVVGGARFGLATAFVTDGIHKADFEDVMDDAGRFQKIAEFAQEYGVWPNWVIRQFRW